LSWLDMESTSAAGAFQVPCRANPAIVLGRVSETSIHRPGSSEIRTIAGR